jgi:hypothetical protein
VFNAAELRIEWSRQTRRRKVLGGIELTGPKQVRQLLAQILMQAAGLSVEELDDDKR